MASEKRLIDADKALKIVYEQGIAHPDAYHLTNYATLILREAPTVDAVEVIRCKDCKHYDGKWFCKISGVPSRKPCDFCSHGERKEGAN